MSARISSAAFCQRSALSAPRTGAPTASRGHRCSGGWSRDLAGSQTSILAGLVVGVVFARRQQTPADPLLDLCLFRSAAFSAALAANVLDFFVAFAASLFIAQYLQLVLGLSPLQAGLWMLPSSLGLIVGSLLTPLLVRRARPALVMAAGMILAAVGFGLLTRLDPAAGLAVLVTGSVAFSLGSAPMTTSATDLMVGTALPERPGRRRGSRRPARSSAGRWVSPSLAASAAPCTAVR
jgi:Major Facilitator Superfamily